MSFLNWALLGGAMAFTIPLVIHLMHRSRFTTVDWGAMHLLASVIRVNRRRMQITNLLLLLLRCLIPILLAACLARPVITGFQALQGDAPTSLILVIDDSRSMAAANDSGRSPIESAKQQIRVLLGEMSRRDEIILVRSSRIGAPASRMGVADAIKRVAGIQAVSGPVELGKLIDASADAAKDATHANRRVLIVSDFQANSVGSATLDTARRYAASELDVAAKPVFSFLNVGGDAGEMRNVSVDEISIDSPAVVAGRTARFSARVRNASDLKATDLRLIWSIDGQPLQPRVISLDERASTTVRLSRVIDEPGVHQVTVAVEHGDALSDDNRRSVAVDVLKEVSVVLVDGKPSKEPLAGHVDYLSMALSPFAFGGDDQPDPVRAEVISESKLIKTLQETRPQVLVLANVGKLNDDQKAEVAKFVLLGGSLMVFDGDAVKPETYNEAWKAEDGEIRFPSQLAEVVGNPSDSDALPVKLADPSDQYTPWRLLTENQQQPLGDIDVMAYRKLQVMSVAPVTSEPISDVAATADATGDGESSEEKPMESEQSVVLLSAVNGDPIVVSRGQGDGNIIQFAISANDAWTNFPLRLVYLPMMQQMVLDLAGKNDAATLQVGDPVVIPVAALISVTDVGESEDSDSPNGDKSDELVRRSYTIETPGGDHSINPIIGTDGADKDDEAGKLVWTATHQPGAYRIRCVSTKARTSDAEPTVTSTLRVVEVAASESRLEDVESSRLENVAQNMSASVFTEIGDFRADERVRRFGREIWRWLLVALLVALVAEVWLQQNMVRRSGLQGARS
ncbi:BatA domain-containing protein [Stieleria varia]|uniref:Aerotolerance regulator N-terminal domain-containing protein n=1 Tax=Stieleria varia TaxID=2528005 RepID=A0A5C6B6P8_9BACT|nr:BatA domain-containing protein [Stieleria varia]TWU07743.1 hypothetical protein Pla52n_03160 [Stieleria varia]